MPEVQESELGSAQALRAQESVAAGVLPKRTCRKVTLGDAHSKPTIGNRDWFEAYLFFENLANQSM
jgi:hypothetical protein